MSHNRREEGLPSGRHKKKKENEKKRRQKKREREGERKNGEWE